MGLTQEQLAERSGFSTNYIARLEIGMSVPSLSSVVRLAKALRTTVPDMLTGDLGPVTKCDECAALISPLDAREKEYAIDSLRRTVAFILSLRNAGPGG